MVHYIRFLKTPRLTQGKTSSLTTLITITTDLGETFLAVDVSLEACVIGATDGQVITRKPLQWYAGFRDLSIVFDKVNVPRTIGSLRVVVRVSDGPSRQSSRDVSLPSILDAWSASFKLSQGSIAAPLVERRFQLGAKNQLKIWEETGNSIALHIWDAAIGFLQNLHHDSNGCEDGGKQPCCLINQLKRPARIVELGAGCGIVGIALASLYKSLQVTLTDLPEAMEIMERNVANAKPAHDSTLQQSVLDWDEDLPSDLSTKVDIIIVSDCTYNADALPSLVKVLTAFAKASPEVKIIVAMKRRHDSEEIFFDLMKTTFQQAESLVMPLPHMFSDQDFEDPKVELYTYQTK